MPTSPARLLFTLARAAGKAATSKLRLVGAVAEAEDWPVKAAVCERCPLRVVQCNVSYCGRPLLKQVVRDPVQHGCGCPTRAKAKDPSEHCPITARHEASTGDANCQCKWCDATRPQVLPAAA